MMRLMILGFGALIALYAWTAAVSAFLLVLYYGWPYMLAALALWAWAILRRAKQRAG
jgi:hypothetical protein